MSPTLGLAGLLDQFFDHADDFDDGLVAEFDGVGDVVFLHLAAPTSIMLTKCLVPATTRSMSLYSSCSTVGFRTSLPSTRPTRTWAVGREGNVADGDGGAGGDAGEHVGIVLPIGGQDVQVNLHFVHESLGEQGAQRAVDQAGGEDFLGGGRPSRFMNPPGNLPAAARRSR
jgi:hypothetical protein